MAPVITPLRSFLDRFRRTAAVPAFPSEDLSSEVEPLFGALDAIEAEGDARRAAAARRAESAKAAVEAEIEELLGDARERAEVERGEAMEVRRRAAQAAARAVVETGEAAAAATLARGRERIGGLVAEVVRCVREEPA